MIRPLPLSFVVCLLAAACCAAAEPIALVEAAAPVQVAELNDAQVARLRTAAEQLETWSSEQFWSTPDQPDSKPDDVLAVVRTLIDTKTRVDAALDGTLPLRTQFAALPADDLRRETIRQYLETTSILIDLSGRIRYTLRDIIDEAAYELDAHLPKFHELIDLVTEQRVEIGAAALAYVLLDPPSESGAVPYPPATKAKVLKLLTVARDMQLLPQVATFLRQATTTPDLAIMAAHVVRHTGLPQDIRPGSDPTLPRPAITASELKQRLERINPSQLPPVMRATRQELIDWLAVRAEKGALEDSYRCGDFEVKAGDWLLMRNPSPYNMFTDLSPGLFTHVGAVSTEVGKDGKRRFVIVDLPERGDRIPATNVDAYLLRTLHYVFLRHEDAATQSKLATAAADMIGNETEFDLTFRTSRVLELKDKPLKGQRINTYCAGFLLLCAQTTDRPRGDFFPIPEYPAGGHCMNNLAKLGLSIGDDFVSPTGAMFSPSLEIVGRREPMYSPDREIKEAVYDHFAKSMADKILEPSPGAAQALRVRLARLANANPLLARVLARANNVSEHMDLESAARAAGVIETLDEIADENMNAFLAARAVILSGPSHPAQAARLSAEQVEQIRVYRSRHEDLWTGWMEQRLSPRDLRMALVEFYCDRGRQQLDARFFPSK